MTFGGVGLVWGVGGGGGREEGRGGLREGVKHHLWQPGKILLRHMGKTARFTTQH